MTRTVLLLATFVLIASFCRSQIASRAIPGNYIGQSVTDRKVMTVDVKENHKYVLKTYDSKRKLQKKIKGKWTFDGDKLVLVENTGKTTVLEKYNDIWYIADKNGRSCLARFYQNKDPNEFWAQLVKEGC